MAYDHGAFRVSNLEKAIAFYTGKLGFRQLFLVDSEAFGERGVFLEYHGARLELIETRLKPLEFPTSLQCRRAHTVRICVLKPTTWMKSWPYFGNTGFRFWMAQTKSQDLSNGSILRTRTEMSWNTLSGWINTNQKLPEYRECNLDSCRVPAAVQFWGQIQVLGKGIFQNCLKSMASTGKRILLLL